MMTKLLQRWLCALWLLVAATSLRAAIEELSFDSEEQRERYQALIEELRCPKCLNANLAGSDAPIAADLRAETYEQVLEGKSDEEIRNFMVERYGEFVLYRPRLHASTAILWFGPPLLLLGGFFILWRMLVSSRRQAVESAELSPGEQQQLQELLADDPQNQKSDTAKTGQ